MPNREEQLLVASLDRSREADHPTDPRITVDIDAPLLMAPDTVPAPKPLPEALAGWYYIG